MITLRELQDWIDNLPDDPDQVVYVDEGGLTLVAETDEVMNSLEVGGAPNDDLLLEDNGWVVPLPPPPPK